MRSLAALTFASVAISGCISLPVDSGQGFTNCIQSLQYDPSLLPIKQKVALSGGNENLFDRLADNSYPTDYEKSLLRLWGNKRQYCANSASINDLGFNESQSLVSRLANGSISYGQFARDAQEMIQRIYERRSYPQQQRVYVSPPQQAAPTVFPTTPSPPAQVYKPPTTTTCSYDSYFKETRCVTQ